MIISINEMSEIPIYQQIRNQIVQGISDGRLSPGEQLPTVRGLAEEIGINSMTVNKAYSLLKQEGCRLPRLLTQQGLTTIERVDDAG